MKLLRARLAGHSILLNFFCSYYVKTRLFCISVCEGERQMLKKVFLWMYSCGFVTARVA